MYITTLCARPDVIHLCFAVWLQLSATGLGQLPLATAGDPRWNTLQSDFTAILTDKPVLLGQFGRSGESRIFNQIDDPFMLIVPRECSR